MERSQWESRNHPMLAKSRFPLFEIHMPLFIIIVVDKFHMFG